MADKDAGSCFIALFGKLSESNNFTAPAFKTLGRWSRWRRANDRYGSHPEVLETRLDLLEFAKMVGLFDVTKERYR